MNKPFFKKAVLTTAALTSATLLAFGPDASASEKPFNSSTPVANHTVVNQEDLEKFIDILNQSIYEKDGKYFFDSEKAVELGLTEEEAQVIAKIWDTSSEFIEIVSQSIYVEDGEYKFDVEKAQELGFTEKEALIVDKIFTSFSHKIQILKASIVEADGEYSFDIDAAIEAGASPAQVKIYEKLFNSLSQEQLAAIYNALHPEA
ncbi:hypothetical protein [Bacillus atrophaeus]|uniref:hypothetical protein n=1 Tax=Bacillus atrophaeus TaxID=1452 RepID=UPI00032E8021|nr:hypothetical protein [Bacillus atrophaeus]AKL84237.1 YlaE [Bacillus atrophaeus UCMB-5137]MEC1902302.1 hypothetical protein [Bacillus atrophaeus]MEC2397595.1 hypothetical protein [Bacillus atrophaeus]MED4434562.1 hypothetical protein [Bacillus atrophaeus]MED4567193.1 hypothetical protein [Bacillus atrophaeus]